MAYDLIIRGGTIADGKGTALYEADVAVTDGRIAEIGKVSGTAAEEIDASGLLVTPGFVEIHSHYDGQAMWDERLLSSGWHGVTTTLMGNCGVGFAPVHDGDHDLLIELMEGVEDIPGDVLREGIKWDWGSFPDYLDALERRSYDMDVCAHLPHSALRVFVMGARAVRREEATNDDIAAMRTLCAEAMEAGAMGFSTSRSFNHMTLAGDYIPSLGATGEELNGIAQGLTDADKGVLQLILNWTPDPEDRKAEFAIVRDMVKASGRPLSVTVLQRLRDPKGCWHAMDMIDEAVAEGLDIHAQTTPRPLGTLFGLDMVRNPFCFHPSYRAIADEPLARKVEIMRDPAFKEKLLSEQPDQPNETLVKRVTNFEYMFPLGDPPNYAPTREDSVAYKAEAQGRDAFEFAYDLLLEDDGHSMMLAPNSGYANHSIEGIKDLLEHPRVVMGVSDGGAHVAHISDSSFSTFLLSYWGRDRPQGALDTSWLVQQMTGDTAAMVGLHDRGVLAPGYKADINVIDFDRLRNETPYMVHDLPLGGKRLLQRARGYVATIVSGQVVYREGEATGALPGRLVRGAQTAPAA